MLTATPLQISDSAPPDPNDLAQAYFQAAAANAASLMPIAPFPLEQTFLLHSNPTATKTIYLDFDGFLTRNTQWNTDQDLPNILTPAYSLDADYNSFSSAEQLVIQNVWERVSEDYRPFNVDVTTEDPGVEALRKGGVNLPPVASTDVGQVIDELSPVFSTIEFSGPTTSISDVNVTLNISHTFDSDLTVLLISPQGTSIQLFSGVGGAGNNFSNTVLDDQAATAITDPAATPPFAGSFQPQEALSAFNGEDPNGIWTLVVQDDVPGDDGVLNGWSLTIGGSDQGDTEWGQRVVIGGSEDDWYDPEPGRNAGGVSYGSFNWDTDTPNFVFGADYGAAAADIAEAVSHEVGHALGLKHDGQFRYYMDVGEDPPEFVRLYVEYYEGHGSGQTAWAPIMGVGYGKYLTQWSKGEYFNATNDKDGTEDLQDDLEIITNRDGNNENGFGYRTDDHGNTTGAADALDLEADQITFSGEGIIERNTDIDFFSFTVEGLGELVSFDIQPFYNGPNLDILAKLYDSTGTVIATGGSIDELGATFTDQPLLPGTYYVSIQGQGRPLTFIDPMFHPGPFEAMGNPPDPALPPDLSDWGYSNYGSLGYYTITGTRKTGLVVGVDFDVAGGASPLNWNLYTGGTGPEDTLKNLISEVGATVPYQLTVSTTGTSINTFDSDNGIDPADVPTHGIPLDDLDGFISAENETLSFTWSNLSPSTVYQIYVFGHADFDAENVVTVNGGLWNGLEQSFNFTQDISADSLNVNENLPGNQDLSTLSLLVISDENGEIKIDVTNAAGTELAVAGLAIAPTKVGSISGTKWNDANGNRTFDGSEDGLAGWTIYLDLNNNGQLDQNISPNQTLTQASTDIPQAIPDQDIAGVKSALDFAGVGKIEDINVTLDITHGYDADLHAVLISPTGTRVKLFTNVGTNGDNFLNTVFDDSAALPIATQQAPFTGTFRPQEPLSAFNNEDAAGQWKLELIDDSVGDVGTLNSWSITIKLQGVSTYLEPVQITDANGDYTFNFLQPGLYNVREYISPAQVVAGWHQTWAPAPFTLRSGSNLQNVNFGNWIPINQSGSISGQKYYDANQDGVNDEEDPGLPGWVVYIDSNNNGVRDVASAPTVITSTDVPKAITDFDTTTSQVTVNSLGTIFNVEVTLDVTHSFIDDLDVYLVSPSGRSVELFTGVGGQYNDLDNLTLSDGASRGIATIGFNDLPYSGTWKPEGLLSDFGGEDAAGIWTLVITDTDFADQGTLNSWSLSITSGELFRTTDDDGNFEFANLSPGNYTVREEQKPGWVQLPPTTTGIPASTWTGTGWDVTVEGTDDFNLPVPDSHRNVKNVDFGNYAPAGSISGFVYRDLDATGTKAATEPGLPGWRVFIDSNNNGILDTDTVDATVTSDAAQAINNFFTVSSQLYFGSMTSISDVDVTLDISHTYDADLSVYLISPSGTRVKLFAGVGGSGDNFQGTSFDDSALQSITAVSASAPFADVFKSEEPLSIFNGENATGYWTLEIKDNALADNGSLNSWSLSIKGDELSVVTDAQGHYSFANLPPNVYHLDTVQIPDWTRTEAAGAVTLLPSQNLLNANFGEHPPYLPGDFNSDGLVDSSDFLVWRRQSGTNVPAFSGADGDGDGDVDQADLGLWRQNFGKYRDDHGNDALAATGAVLPAAIGGKIEIAGDVDWFSFSATAGTQYRIKATLGTLDAGDLQLFGTNGTTQLAASSGVTPLINWTAPANGVYFAQVKGLNPSSVGAYSINLTQVVTDDYGNDAATATLISVPGSPTGQIEIANDVDWFKFAATAGSAYNITAQLGTLPYATLRVIGTDGTSELLSEGGFGPSVQWIAPSSGTFYLEVGGQTTTGTYFVSIAVDDYGNTPGTATPIAVPSTTAGILEAPEDVDVFSFVAASGTSYRFRTTLNTLDDSTLTLFAPDGTTELAYDDDGGSGLDSLIDWTAPTSGTYFVQVAGFGSAYGSYGLVSSITAPGSGSSTISAPAASGLMMVSASAPPLAMEEPVSSTGDSSSLSSFAVAPQGAHSGSADDGTQPVSGAGSESADQNDLALLAWLASSSGGNDSDAGEFLADDDVSASRLGDESESMDMAFELLEGNALALATI